MDDWRKHFSDDWQKLSAESQQGGTAFAVRVVTVPGFEKALTQIDTDEDARALLASINSWFDYANAARADDVWPKCVSCEHEVRAGDVCGWVVFTPIEREKEIGMAGVFCAGCLRLGPQKISENAMKRMEMEGAASIVRRQ